MSQPPPASAFAPTPDPLTPARDITHAHFQAGDTVVVLRTLRESGERMDVLD